MFGVILLTLACALVLETGASPAWGLEQRHKRSPQMDGLGMFGDSDEPDKYMTSFYPEDVRSQMTIDNMIKKLEILKDLGGQDLLDDMVAEIMNSEKMKEVHEKMRGPAGDKLMAKVIASGVFDHVLPPEKMQDMWRNAKTGNHDELVSLLTDELLQTIPAEKLAEMKRVMEQRQHPDWE